MSGLMLDHIESGYVDTFAFKPGHIPLSTHASVATAILVYLVVVYALKDFIRHRGKPYDLRSVSVVYNAALSLMSAYLLYQHCAVMHRLLSVHSFWSVLCDERAQHLTGAKTLSLYLIYLTKYLELSDTLLLCLRGKSTPFIHIYHHAVTVLFAYIGLREATCLGWTMPILNLAVHVFLYAYFALVESGRRVWWKRYLTLMQVTQFYLTMVPTFVALVPKLIWNVSPNLPFAHNCHGGWPGVYIGLPLLFVYLYLFQSLYRGKYQADDSSISGKERLAAVKGR